MDKKYNLSIETVTPERAKAFIGTCERNRNPSAKRIECYAKMISDGTWGPFSMLIFDENGNLIDGGHRLSAVIKANKPANFVIFRGLEKTYIPFIDTGRPRTAGDMLAFIEEVEGVPSLRNAACIVRGAVRYFSHDLSGIVSPDTLATEIIDNKVLLCDVMKYYTKIKPIGGTCSSAAALYIIRKVNKGIVEEIDDFVEKVANGENINCGMPEYAVRQAIFTAGRFRRSAGNDGGSRQIRDLFTILRGWSGRIKGEEVKLIKPYTATTENVFDLSIIK